MNEILLSNKNTITSQNRQNLIDYLFAGKSACVIRNRNEIRVFRTRDVKELYRLLKEKPEFLNEAFVADKVVGKAAAAWMILGGVEEVFADVAGQPGYKLFCRARVHTEYAWTTPHISLIHNNIHNAYIQIRRTHFEETIE